MGNNTKSEQDDLCLALINPELCKRSSIEVAIEQHDTETTIPYLHVFLDNMWDLKKLCVCSTGQTGVCSGKEFYKIVNKTKRRVNLYTDE